MNAAYPLLTKEDVAQLQAAEKAARDKARTDRLRLLRVLKEERVAGVSQAAEVLGYNCSTLVAVLARRRLGGAAGATAATLREGAHLAGGLGGFAGGDAGGSHRREAQLYLRDTWHIAYGIDAISKLFRRRKLKTGRPHHRNSPTDQAAFTK